MTRLFIICLLFLFSATAHAYVFSGNATHAIVMDYNSRTIILEQDADTKMFPSSMSKLMTLYVVFSKLKSGIIKLTDVYTVSTAAWKKGGSSMFLEPQQRVTVLGLLRGVIIVSGNDAAITLSEGTAGSEENFVKEMNKIAQDLGLTNSHFANSTGWPSDEHMMSARDLLILSIKLFEDFPEYYYLFSEKEFTYNKIYQPNTNELLWSNIGVDGIKTGSTEAGGFGLVFSAQQDNRRIFAVINGLKNKKERRKDGERLIQYIFNNFNNKTLFTANQQISQVRVLLGAERQVPLVTHDDITITYKRGEEKQIKVIASHDNIVKAPIEKNQRLGSLKIYIPEQEMQEIPLYAQKNVEKLSFIKGIIRKTELLFGL